MNAMTYRAMQTNLAHTIEQVCNAKRLFESVYELEQGGGQEWELLKCD
jgi:hypothetical protein